MLLVNFWNYLASYYLFVFNQYFLIDFKFKHSIPTNTWSYSTLRVNSKYSSLSDLTWFLLIRDFQNIKWTNNAIYGNIYDNIWQKNWISIAYKLTKSRLVLTLSFGDLLENSNMFYYEVVILGLNSWTLLC